MTGDPLGDEVKRFVADALAVRIERLTLVTRQFHDLGVDGADGLEFMAAFGQHFGVDTSEFKASLHFGPEAGCNPFLFLVLRMYRPRSLRLVPITVGDLVEAARSGRWHSPDRNPA